MKTQPTQLRDTIDGLLAAAEFDQVVEACKLELVDARRRQDRETEIMALIGLAQAHKYLGKFYEARVYNNGALEYAQDSDNPVLAVMALNVSGSLHLTASYRVDEAESDYRAALNLAHDIRDVQGVIAALAGVAAVLNQIGDIKRASNYAREAFDLARDSQDALLMATTLGILGNAFLQANQHEKALKTYQDALKISEDNGIRLLEGLFVGHIGRLLAEEGRYFDEGIEMLERFLDMAQSIRCVPQEFTALYLLGSTRAANGQVDEAQKYFETMLQRAQTWKNRAYEGISFSHLGRLHLNAERYDEARANFEQALLINRETMNPFQEAQTEAVLGLTCVLNHDYDEALGHYMAARALYDALDDSARVRDMMKAIVYTYLSRLLDRVLRFFGLRHDDEDAG